VFECLLAAFSCKLLSRRPIYALLEVTFGLHVRICIPGVFTFQSSHKFTLQPDSWL